MGPGFHHLRQPDAVEQVQEGHAREVGEGLVGSMGAWGAGREDGEARQEACAAASPRCSPPAMWAPFPGRRSAPLRREVLIERFRQSLRDPSLPAGSIPAVLRDKYGPESPVCSDNLCPQVLGAYKGVLPQACGAVDGRLSSRLKPHQAPLVPQAADRCGCPCWAPLDMRNKQQSATTRVQ